MMVGAEGFLAGYIITNGMVFTGVLWGLFLTKLGEVAAARLLNRSTS